MIKLREWLWLMVIPVYWIWKNDLLTVLLNGHFLSFSLQMIFPILVMLMGIGGRIANDKLGYYDKKEN